MQLSIGDEVVYPRRGVGRITGLERLDLVEGFDHYVVIEILGTGLTVRVPVRKMEELGVRPVMSRAKLVHVLDTLRGRPHPLSEDFRERQDWVRERLETGGSLEIAEIVRDLTWYEQHSHLTKVDSDLLARGRESLSVEIALATRVEVVDAKHTIDEALKTAIANEPAA